MYKIVFLCSKIEGEKNTLNSLKNITKRNHPDRVGKFPSGALSHHHGFLSEDRDQHYGQYLGA